MTGIVSIVRDWGDAPSIVRIQTTDNLTTVGGAGYLTDQADNIAAANNGPFQWQASDMALVYASDGWEFCTISADQSSLDPFLASPTVIGTPVVVGNFAVFESTSGNLEDLGYLPSDATKTRVVMAGSSVVANMIAHFVDTTGTIDDTAANVTNLGNIYAGASGTAGVLRSYPAGATSGYLGLTGVANGGDYAVQIANVSHGQATIHSIVDPGNAAARFLIGATATPFTSGNFPVASGTGGLMVDSGLAATNIQHKDNIVAAQSADIGGAGAGPIDITVSGAASTSVAVATVLSSSNAVSILNVLPGSGKISVTFSGDPGAAAVINYVVFKAAQ